MGIIIVAYLTYLTTWVVVSPRLLRPF